MWPIEDVEIVYTTKIYIKKSQTGLKVKDGVPLIPKTDDECTVKFNCLYILYARLYRKECPFSYIVFLPFNRLLHTQQQQDIYICTPYMFDGFYFCDRMENALVVCGGHNGGTRVLQIMKFNKYREKKYHM